MGTVYFSDFASRVLETIIDEDEDQRSEMEQLCKEILGMVKEHPPRVVIWTLAELFCLYLEIVEELMKTIEELQRVRYENN